MAKSEEKKEMKVVKKYTAIMISKYHDERMGEDYVQLAIGGESRYSSSKMIFDTEEEAINHAYQVNKWVNWLVVPVITFDNF